MTFSLPILCCRVQMDVRDPIRQSVEDTWIDTVWKQDFWETNYCQDTVQGTPAVCKTTFPLAAHAALAHPRSMLPPSTKIGEVFADCATAEAKTAAVRGVTFSFLWEFSRFHGTNREIRV
eukprot:SAG31_NODE_5399_length_2555_cov_1.499797_4_plen_120_part_00